MARITKDPEVRRNELMDVAERLFAEKGYDHTSPSDIIREAGVAQGTFYYYFKSKDDLVRAVIVRYIERYKQYASEVAADPGLDAPEKVRRISDGLWDLSVQKARQGIDEGSFKVEFPEEMAGYIIVISKYLHDELKHEADPGVRSRKIEATRAAMERVLGARKGIFRSRP
jgi:AcrR family transcriptional regulator